MKKLSFIIPAVTTIVLLAHAPLMASEGTYTLGTFEARTNISFVGEADLETIHGFTNKISGVLRLGDKAAQGETVLSVDVANLDTGIPLRDEHLRDDKWLNAAKYPKIELKLSKITARSGGKIWDYEGSITIRGVTKPLKGEARLRFVDAAQAERFQLGAGKWVNVKSDFEVNLADFGLIIPEGLGMKVSSTWKVSVDIWGTTAP